MHKNAFAHIFAIDFNISTYVPNAILPTYKLLVPMQVAREYVSKSKQMK